MIETYSVSVLVGEHDSSDKLEIEAKNKLLYVIGKLDPCQIFPPVGTPVVYCGVPMLRTVDEKSYNHYTSITFEVTVDTD